MRFIIKYFLKFGSSSSWFLRRSSGVNPSPASSAGALPAEAPGSPPAAAGASLGADYIPGKDMVDGGG